MKILVVSDATNFALTDVYNGYINALEQLKIPYESHPYHHFRGICSDATCFHRIHSLVLTKPKEFTHIMFIGGLNVPDYIFDSLYHIKSIVIATEDPHSFDPMKHKLQKINYYFSNERSIGESKKFKNTYYCPTAGDTQECGRIPRDFLDEKYKSDILFLGAIYPNRRKLLESIIPFIEENKLSLKICGHVHYMPKSSPLWKYVYDARTIPHIETVKYYNGAKIVLNMLRDTTWNPRTKSGKNPHNRSKFTADSLNPRAYEVPLCQSFMLLEDNRIEAKEVFTDTEVGFFSNEESLIERLQYFMFGKGKPKINDMIIKAYNKVSTKHTYLHRMLYVKSILEQDSN
jgi:spore maturation protein CgeB